MTAPLSEAPAKPARPRPSIWMYGVVDIRDPEAPTLVGVKDTRKECKEVIQWSPDADTLRARRIRIIVYDK